MFSNGAMSCQWCITIISHYSQLNVIIMWSVNIKKSLTSQKQLEMDNHNMHKSNSYHRLHTAWHILLEAPHICEFFYKILALGLSWGCASSNLGEYSILSRSQNLNSLIFQESFTRFGENSGSSGASTDTYLWTSIPPCSWMVQWMRISLNRCL